MSETHEQAWRDVLDEDPSVRARTLKVPDTVKLVVQGHAWRLDVSDSNVVHAILALGQAHFEALPVRTD